MPIAPGFLTRLENCGWARAATRTTDPHSLASTLQTVASALRKPTADDSPAVEWVLPKPTTSARPQSLSGRFGLGAFPLHCDTSHWPVPCRYVLLACMKPGALRTPTALLDLGRLRLSPSQAQRARSSVFLIRSGPRSFYSTILSSTRTFTRLDPGCMVPLDHNGVRAMALFGTKRNQQVLETCDWRPGDVLAIDNWRVLHGRLGCVSVTDQRLLLRLLVK